MTIPNLRDAYVCRETIYNAIYALPVGELRKELIVCLRQGKTTRRPRSGGVDRRGQIPEMVSIHVRPPEIEDRLMPGHWEGDLIKGKANASSVGTLVERTSGYLMLMKMNDATATSAMEGFSAALNSMPLAMRKSMTYDQGREMARHAEITQQTGVAIYFCDPGLSLTELNDGALFDAEFGIGHRGSTVPERSGVALSFRGRLA